MFIIIGDTGIYIMLVK